MFDRIQFAKDKENFERKINNEIFEFEKANGVELIGAKGIYDKDLLITTVELKFGV